MSTASRGERAWRIVAQVCAGAAGIGALAAAVGWLFGGWGFATFGPDYIPMAPSTAWLLVLLSVATLLHNAWPHGQVSRLLGILAAGLSGLFGLLVIVCRCLSVDVDFALGLARTTARVNEIPVGRMSLHTAATLLVAAGALGCLLGSGQRRWWRTAAFLSAAVVFGSGTVAAVGYAVGVPFLYGSGEIPMALLTALVLALWGAGVMIAARSESGPLQWLAGEPGGAGDATARRFRWALVVAFLVLLAGIGTTGFFYLRRHLDDSRRKAEETLAVIAEMKAAQIAAWRHERLADAELVRYTPYAARRAVDVLKLSDSATTREMFTSWLAPLLAVGPYEQALLLDAEGKVRLVFPEAASAELSEADFEAAQHTLTTRQFVLSDLHRDTDDGPVRVSIMVPMVVRREGTRDEVPAAGQPPSPNDRAAGVLVLHVNVEQSLFGSVKAWPTPSRSAETLLVRRDGDAVLCLNELRQRPRAALRLRVPMTHWESLLVRAVRGERGLLAGLDYRGVPIVALARPVEGTEWTLVVTVDKQEIYAPIRERGWAASVIVGSLVLAVLLALNLLWRQRDAEFLRRELHAITDRERVERQYQTLFGEMLNGFALHEILCDAAGRPVDYRFLAVNPAFERLTGLRAADLVGRTLLEALPGTERTWIETYGHVALTGEPAFFEEYTSTLQKHFQVTAFQAAPGQFACIFADITERKRAENALCASLEEKTALLKEVHHRVKNNLQIVASLLNLQARGVQNREAAAVLQDTRNRVYSMALLHELLYRSENLARIDFAAYVDALCAQIQRSLGTVGGRIEIERQVAPIHLPLEQAVPCGLILTELVANALKHGFPGDRTGRVWVELHADDEKSLVLCVSDDGVGLPAGLDIATTATLGLQLVHGLAGQLGGTCHVAAGRSAGAAFRVTFPIPDGTVQERAS